MKRTFFMALIGLSGYTWGQLPGGVQGLAININGDFKPQMDVISKHLFPDIGLLNYNPAFQYDGKTNSVFLPIQLSEFSQATVFVVYRNAEPDIEQNVWNINGLFGTTALTTKKVNDFSGDLSFETSAPTSTIINTYIKAWRTQEINEVGDQELLLGKGTNGAALFKGKIAEFLLYDRVLKVPEQRRIESYLAIKYGVCLKHDFISSSGKTLWSAKNNSAYNHRIIGIGKDLGGSIYQKQSESKDGPFSMEIGAGGIETSNAENKAVINDQDFLLLGDNDGGLQPEAPNQTQIPISLLNRHWLMNVTGMTASTIPTELKINIARIFPGKHVADDYVLSIDRSGAGDFSSNNTEYFIADDLSEDGTLTFKNIYWDTDLSGKDVFSFGIRSKAKAFLPDNITENDDRGVIVYPNPSTNGYFNLEVHLEKPESLQIEVYDEKGSLVQTMFGNGRKQYYYNGRINGASGIYTFRISTPGKKISKRLAVQ